MYTCILPDFTVLVLTVDHGHLASEAVLLP